MSELWTGGSENLGHTTLGCGTLYCSCTVETVCPVETLGELHPNVCVHAISILVFNRNIGIPYFCEQSGQNKGNSRKNPVLYPDMYPGKERFF